MNFSNLSLPLLLVSGPLSFVAYFVRGEHHMHIVRYIQILALIGISSVLYLVWLDDFRVPDAINVVAKISSVYLTGLFTAKALYRLIFHPLNKFPGALGARITSFWFTWRVRRLDCFRQVKALHDRYGQFVRIGPNNLSITHPLAYEVIHGPGSKCSKSEWYDAAVPDTSLHTYRDKQVHAQRRRVWSAAFGDQQVRGYEKRLRPYRQKLINNISEPEGEPTNIAAWFDLYSMDIVGDLAFNQSFEMLDKGGHWAVKLLHDSLLIAGLYFPIWFFRVLLSIPFATRDWWRFINFCASKVEARLRTPVEIPDIMTALLAPLKGRQPSKEEFRLLRAESQLIIVAGSDTTASSLTAAVYQLARHPEQIKKLQEILDPYVDEPGGEILNERIAHVDHLNAVINETLRLNPAVPTMIPRKTPPEGIVIGEEFIPGNMIVSCPPYAMGRSSAAYVDPEAFIPERWTTRPELVKEKRAFAPFSTGTYSCIGRPLAMLNLRTTLARLVTQYDFDFAPDEDGSSFEGKAKETFTFAPGPVMVTFRKRTSLAR